MIKYENEEHLKDLIFDIFSKCKNEISSDRRQVHFARLCELIYKWCKDFQFKKDIDNMGKEIVNVTCRIIKNKTINKVPNEKEGFIKYLRTALNTEKAAFYRNNENDNSKSIKTPKEKKAKLKKVLDIILMQECNLGRILTKDEQLNCISEWFDNIQEYNDIFNAMRIGRLEFIHNNDGEEIDSLNSSATPIYMGNISINPINNLLLKEYKEIISDAIDTILEGKQERSRDCYRALFTLYCVDKNVDLEGLSPVLDSTVIQDCSDNDKYPKQYEIYQKYHPNTQKSAAEAMASKNIKDFKKELDSYLKEKNPEILF